MAQNGARRVTAVDMLNSVANPTMKLLLRSPLHGLAGGSTMLITVTGRKTAARYTTPVNYVRDGNSLTAFSRRRRSWWWNLRGGAPVTVRLRGRELPGRAELVEASPEEAASQLLARRPSLSAEKARDLAAQLVLVRIGLDARQV